MERGRYVIDDGNAWEKADTVERAVAIISGWYDNLIFEEPTTEGVDIPNFRGILEDTCGGEEPTVVDLQDAINDWIRQIVASKPVAFSGGEYDLPLSVRESGKRR